MNRHDQRWIRHEPQLAVHDVGSLREGAQVVAGPCLGEVIHRLFRLGLAQAFLPHRVVDPGQDRVTVDVVVPDVESPHLRGAAHDRAIGRDRRDDDVASVRTAEAELAPADLEAGGKPLHVPLPGPGKRLVEVVDVEQQLPLGRREDPEVREVGVAAELNGDARARGRREIGRHDQRRAAEEGERRREHPAMTHRDELLDPIRALLLEQRNRVGPIVRRLPRAVARPRRTDPGRLPALDPLRGRERLAARASRPLHRRRRRHQKKVLGSAGLAPGVFAPGRRAQAPALDRLAERVGGSLQALTDLGQLSRRQVDPLRLNLGALLLVVGTLLELTLEIVDVPGEIRELGGNDRDVVFIRHLHRSDHRGVWGANAASNRSCAVRTAAGAARDLNRSNCHKAAMVVAARRPSAEAAEASLPLLDCHTRP